MTCEKKHESGCGKGISETTFLRFSKHFEQFELLKEGGDQKSQIVYKNQNEEEKKKLKHKINLKENLFTKMRLKYVDETLTKMELIKSDNSKEKFKLSKKPKNKNVFYVEFNFLCRVELILPILKNQKVIGFFCKYAQERETCDTQFAIKERESDIVIPDNHVSIWKSVQSLPIRVDMTFFLKGKELTSEKNLQYRNSISNLKVKTGVLQDKAKSLCEQMAALCPNLKIAKNHFKTNTIGQFKLFILGFSEIISPTKQMKFSK